MHVAGIRKHLKSAAVPAVAVALLLQGCATDTAESELSIASAQYAAAFDAAIDAARREGMAASFRDRRAGVIETEPVIGASLLEPWRVVRSTAEQARKDTISLQRRRARVEFIPQAAPDSSAAPDLTTFNGPIDVRIAVVVERSSSPALRRSTWTRGGGTAAIVIDPDDGTPLAQEYWLPVTRDPVMEHRLLEAVHRAISPPAGSADAAPRP